MHILDANEIFGITAYTYDRIMEAGGKFGPDAFAVYFKLLEQTRIQQTNQTFTLNKFLMNFFSWGDDRVSRAKGILKNLGLIDDIIIRDDFGKIKSHYVRVNYLIDENKVRTACSTYGFTTTPENQVLDFTGPGEIETNALSTKLVNAGNTKHKRKDSDFSELELALEDFKEMRKTIKKPLTSKALKRLSAKLDKLANSDEEKIAILNQSVDHCWQDVYPLKEPISTEPKNNTEWVQLFDKCWDEGTHKSKVLDVYGRDKYEKIKKLWVTWCATGVVDDSFIL